MEQAKEITLERSMKRLEEMNLMDDFLFLQVLLDEKLGENLCRYILSTVLERSIGKIKVVSQKVVPGTNIDRHGIRMDAYIKEMPEMESEATEARVLPVNYDIEPNKVYEKEQLPRKTRYYGALMDSRLLSASTEYSRLEDVIIIMILPYDPFGKNRMVYTMKNQCQEDPSIEYEDGSKIIFLNTKGTVGNPSQKLRDMLQYFEKTTEENAAKIKMMDIQRQIERVKHSEEVGIAYMKSWERENRIFEEGREEGRIELIISLVKDGILDREKGMERAKLSQEEFDRKYKEYCDKK